MAHRCHALELLAHAHTPTHLQLYTAKTLPPGILCSRNRCLHRSCAHDRIDRYGYSWQRTGWREQHTDSTFLGLANRVEQGYLQPTVRRSSGARFPFGMQQVQRFLKRLTIETRCQLLKKRTGICEASSTESRK